MTTRGKKIVYLGLFALVGAMLACSASAITPATEETLADLVASQIPDGSDASGLDATVEPSATVPGFVPTPVGGNGLNSTPTPVSTSTALPSTGATVVINPTRVPAPTAIPGNRMSESMFGPIDCEPSSGEIKLTSHVYDPDQFDTITPMGRMWDSHVTPVDHLYINVSQERARGMVMTPADGRIIRIQRFPNNQSPFWDPSQDEPDIRVIVAHSCDLFSIYIHLGALAPEIADVVGDLAQGESWHAGPGDLIEVEAGDPIAFFGGSTIDYSLHDGNVMLPGFQIPDHYSGEPWKVHTVDPFDYMTEELKAELLPKNERKVAPFGGRIDYDVVGTLAGNWFMDGTNDYGGDGVNPEYWNGHMTIAYDHIDPTQIRISIGRDIGITQDDCRVCGGVYAVNGNSPDPASVTVADGPVKYVLTGRQHASQDSTERTVSNGVVLGTFLVEVLDDTSIRTEFFIGLEASEVAGFTENAIIYRR